MKKRIISLFLIVSIVVSVFAVSAVSASVGAVEMLDTPSIISTESGVGGNVIIKWTPVPNAVKYRVLYKSPSGEWVGIGDTSDTTITGKNAKSGTTYTYSIRCISEDGKAFTSDFNSTGWSHKYVDTPVITTLTPEYNSIRITWGKVTGAVKYRVFYKSGNNWIKLSDTTSNTVVANNPKTNNVYTYTVRAVSADGNTIESGINDGKSIVYNASCVALTTVVGGQINLNNEITSRKDAVIYGKKISSWVVSNTKSVWHRNGSKYLTGLKENSSSIVTATANDGSKMFFSVRVKSFNEAVKGVYCKISGRLASVPSDYTLAKVDVPLYNNKTGSGYSCIVPNGKLAQITDYYNTGSPATSRFKVKYTNNNQTKVGWVEENYALINALGLTPSYVVSLSFSSNRAYTWHKANKGLDNGVYNMFNYKGSVNYISGITDTAYYSSNTAWLRFDFAKKLAQEQARLLQDGYGIKIYDAYRPHAVTSSIDPAWDRYIAKYNLTDKSSAYRASLTNQIASPSYVSRHNFGAAVDISLVVAENGAELKMPTLMHDLSWNAEYSKWINGTSTGDKNAQYLYKAMTYGGFGTYYGEWWHFQDDTIKKDDAVVYCAGN